MSRLIIIGAGNMGRSIIKNLVNKSFPKEIIAVETDSAKRECLPVTSVARVSHLDFADSYTVLGVKPSELKGVDVQFGSDQTRPKNLISILAGVSIPTLKIIFPSANISRAMPNLAMEHQKSNTVFYSECDELAKMTHRIFETGGDPIRVSREDEMDIGTGIIGCGPAFFLKLTKIMASEGQNLGLSLNDSYHFSKAALLAANAIKDDQEDMEDIIQDISSPGGVTEIALETLKRYDFDAGVTSAIRRAVTKSFEIDREVEKSLRRKIK